MTGCRKPFWVTEGKDLKISSSPSTPPIQLIQVHEKCREKKKRANSLNSSVDITSQRMSQSMSVFWLKPGSVSQFFWEKAKCLQRPGEPRGTWPRVALWPLPRPAPSALPVPWARAAGSAQHTGARCLCFDHTSSAAHRSTPSSLFKSSLISTRPPLTTLLNSSSCPHPRATL